MIVTMTKEMQAQSAIHLQFCKLIEYNFEYDKTKITHSGYTDTDSI